MSINTLTGRAFLEETLAPYVTQASLEEQFQEFAQDVETGTFTLPNTAGYFIDKPPNAAINMNGKKITNLDTNIDFSGGIGAFASTATSVLLSTILHPNTGPQNLTSEASYGNKRATDVLDPVALLQTDT